MPDSVSVTTNPSVAVLLATHNGARWLDRQIETVLFQQRVAVRIFVSDDGSTDDTYKHLQRFAQDPRIVLLPTAPTQLGSASANFQRLICDIGAMEFDYFAFCDQDDEWLPGRLALAIERLRSQGADGLSSSVTAFWPDGRESLVFNAQPATDWDYFGGGAGQGCSFVLTRRAMAWIREVLISHREICRAIHYHDWLAYALVRAKGWLWVYHPEPTLRYRQHAGNEIGARGSFSAILLRHKRIASGWYGMQLRTVAQIVERACPSHVGAKWVLAMLGSESIVSRIRILSIALKMRRAPLDRLVFVAYFLTGYLRARQKIKQLPNRLICLLTATTN